MSLRHEFVLLATQPDANHAQLCRRFGVTRQTGYKWRARYRDGDPLTDRSRRPHASPAQTPPAVEAEVVALRETHPAWGGRKIHAVLARTLGDHAPAPSTITGILRRHGLLSAEPPRRDFVRFEADAPNDLWQMDFKGDFVLGDGERCYPLTVTDDHSRFAICVAACSNQRRGTVRRHLVAAFERYGLPQQILCDNGPPWETGWQTDAAGRWRPRCTRLAAGLIRLGISVTHGRPYHPQTQGKEERFHKTLKAEVLTPADGGQAFADQAAIQARFDPWRSEFNAIRPHEAIGLAVPASRYTVSPRAYPSVDPVVAYDAGATTRKVDASGKISFRGQPLHVGRGLSGERVELCATEVEGIWSVRYGHQEVWAVRVLSPP